MWRRAMEKAILRCLVHGGEGLGLAGHGALHGRTLLHALEVLAIVRAGRHVEAKLGGPVVEHEDIGIGRRPGAEHPVLAGQCLLDQGEVGRSEEHTSELQSLMRISYAVFCLKKKKKTIHNTREYTKAYKQLTQ